MTRRLRRRPTLCASLALAACTNGIDPSAPRPYPCNPDAGDADCRGGWVCGRERICHAPEPGAWACDPDGGDTECFGWHCGLAGECYPQDSGVERICDCERVGIRFDDRAQARPGDVELRDALQIELHESPRRGET